MKYTVEYGNPDIHIKRSRFDDFEATVRHFDLCKRIAEKRGYTWVISMWGNDGFLVESITVNPTKIHRVNF